MGCGLFETLRCFDNPPVKPGRSIEVDRAGPALMVSKRRSAEAALE